jgi:hypothetical protein
MDNNIDIASLPPPPAWMTKGKPPAPSQTPKGSTDIDVKDLPPPPAWMTKNKQLGDNPVEPKPETTPQSAGHNWLDTAIQGVKGFVGGMNVPLWNAVGSIPIPAVQRFAQKEAQTAGSLGSPTGQALGQGTTQALSMLAQPEFAPGALSQIGGQAALSGLQSYLTAPQGEKDKAAVTGALSAGLLSGVGAGLSKWLGGGVATPAVDRAAQEAKAEGYKLMPGEATGFGKASQQLINAGKGSAAAHNYNIYEQKLGQLAGVPKGVRVDSDSLAWANKAISDEFASKLAGKTVEIPAVTANAVRSLVEKQPAIAEEVVGATGLSKAFEAAANGEPIPAKDWFAIVRQLKSMRYAQREPNVQFQLSSVINALEEPVKQFSPDVNKAYQKFNRQYRANALLLNTMSGDLQFLQTGKINPVKVWAAAINDAKTTAAQAKTLTTKDPLTQTARLAAQLNLVPQAREEGDAEMMNLLLAGAHTAGAPVSLSLGSINALPKAISHLGIGVAGRALYGSPIGQRLLESGQMVDPLTRKLMQATTRALVPTLPGEFPSISSYVLPSASNQ